MIYHDLGHDHVIGGRVVFDPQRTLHTVSYTALGRGVKEVSPWNCGRGVRMLQICAQSWLGTLVVRHQEFRRHMVDTGSKGNVPWYG